MKYIVIFTLVVLLFIYFIFYPRKRFPLTLDYPPERDVSDLIKTAVIPLNIFQTWNSKSLPYHMDATVRQLKTDNPEFTHRLFDDDECRTFIRQFFPTSVLDAYDALVPGAYKADLWRNCVLYIHGGIYLDIKYKCSPGFKLIELTQQEYFVRDRSIDHSNGKHGIYNALMVCKPKNKILHQCIYAIVDNVKNQYYGENPLYPTGPLLMSVFFGKKEIQDLELSFTGDSIISNPTNISLLVIYPEYRQEQSISSDKPYYNDAWNSKNIYKNKPPWGRIG